MNHFHTRTRAATTIATAITVAALALAVVTWDASSLGWLVVAVWSGFLAINAGMFLHREPLAGFSGFTLPVEDQHYRQGILHSGIIDQPVAVDVSGDALHVILRPTYARLADRPLITNGTAIAIPRALIQAVTLTYSGVVLGVSSRRFLGAESIELAATSDVNALVTDLVDRHGVNVRRAWSRRFLGTYTPARDGVEE